jgi:hypothetical protein
MTETALDASALSRAHPPARARRNRINPLEALERGFALFRSTFGREGWRYYIGTAPLVLGFIPIWVANGQIRISNAALLTEAALLGCAYLLRVSMVGNYMQHVRKRAYSAPKLKPAGAAAQAAAVGRLLAWKIMLSGGALATLPTVAGASWFYGACQFASLDAQEDTIERHSFTGCLALSSQWFGGGVLLFLMLIPLWIAVWLNGLILAMVVPQLLHSIFGVSTLLSTQMGLYSLVQSSAFWLSLSAGAWLALDPIVKCTFVIVYQHLRSRREGDDLRGLLASLPREQQKKARMIAFNAAGGKAATGALLGLTAILVAVSLTAPARAQQIPPAQSTREAADNAAREARIQRLRHALDQESRRAIYRWHDAEHPSAPTAPTWFEKMLAKIGRAMYRAWDALWNFLRKLWPSGLNLSLGNEKGGGWKLKDIRLWLALVAILTLAAGGVLIWLRRRRETASLSLSVAVAPIPDMSDAAAASERSEDEWFALAGQLQGEGELRFALRAAYFGLLAGLEQREWLTIRRDRTNREYLNEFTRRWRRRPQAAVEARAEIPDKLRGSLRQFDCVWYGSHEVTPDAVTAYRYNQREFLNHV